MEETKHALLELTGATCTSCSFAIEHMAERLDGIADVWVDRELSRIHVDYNGDKNLLEQICNFVAQIGYHADIVSVE